MTAHFATSADGTGIAFERFGDGPPVVLVGGALSVRGAGVPLAEELAGLGLSAVVYDRRGRGDSGDTEPYAPAREAEDLAAVVAAVRREEDGGQAYAFGMSSGGLVVLEGAARGASLSRIVLFEPPFTGAAGQPQDPARVARLAELVGRGERGEAVSHFLAEIIGLPPQAVEGARRSPAWEDMKKIAHTLCYDTALLGDATLPDETLAAVRVPALVLSSDESTPVLQEASRATAEALPHAEYRSLPGAFHQVPPEDLAPVVRDFLTA
ncbi:alpha/beta fold hydrolase [Streptomyces smyrnaeus]|uniref:alpha/beta fold hydrolase n=1 Tax=Streptomyces smyrnaeus TaxID=1387713 RepID=UPI0033FCAD3E